MNNENTKATLIAHCGAQKITREKLEEIPIPEPTRTHKPIPHGAVVEVLEEALSFRLLKVVRDEYAISNDGMKMFGVMDLNSEFSGCRFSIGLRNSNDKSMRLALTAGFRVMVCDNMAFSGDFTPLSHKHTSNLNLTDSISIAVDRIHRGFKPMRAQVDAMRNIGLDDEAAKLIIYQAFIDGKIKGLPRHLMNLVHGFYFDPSFQEFESRNLWSLSNAFTSSFKKLNPLKQFEITARLGTFLADVQGDITEKQRLDLRLDSRQYQTSISGNVIPIRDVNQERTQDSDDVSKSSINLEERNPERIFDDDELDKLVNKMEEQYSEKAA